MNMMQKVGAFASKAVSKTKEIGVSVVSASGKALAVAGGIVALGMSAAQPAKAALTTDALESAITSSVTTAEGLITAGFAVTALFLLVKIIKKGAARIG